MIISRAVEHDWKDVEFEGVERIILRRNDRGGRSSLLKMKKGAHFPQHIHQGNEELLILHGQVLIGGVELLKGDYLYTEGGEAHDIVALTDAELFISSEQAMTLIT